MRRFHAPSVLLGFLTVGISLVTSEDQGCQHGSDASTALWSAAKSGDFQKVQGLLQCCADPSYYSKTGSRALHEAAFNGHIPTIKLLLKYGADPNSKKTDGWAPIHLAIRKEINAVAVVKELLHGGAEVNLVTSGPSFTVYDIARNVQMSPAVMDFLRANGGLALHEIAAKSSRDARPYSGSRLHLAARYGDTTAVRDLLKCPEMAKQVSAVDSAGAMPIHEAAFRGFADIVEALLESGADPNARKADGWAAIHLAVRPQIHPVPVLLALIEHGADIDLKTKEGLTAEQMAKQYPGVCESTKTFLSLEGLVVLVVSLVVAAG
ncbi:unnamed protein product [Notodromas monacha]|uniref:Uncharacterized protein n=1 Tax=Notodromas monacha TaxID=399045 RepID=A0A7R9BU97_9CRUS|nr:unnamed protein product [Notodromas monacha]CAG0921522.1 unnamed protein product [Notodromas monacha]